MKRYLLLSTALVAMASSATAEDFINGNIVWTEYTRTYLGGVVYDRTRDADVFDDTAGDGSEASQVNITAAKPHYHKWGYANPNPFTNEYLRFDASTVGGVRGGEKILKSEISTEKSYSVFGEQEFLFKDMVDFISPETPFNSLSSPNSQAITGITANFQINVERNKRLMFTIGAENTYNHIPEGGDYRFLSEMLGAEATNPLLQSSHPNALYLSGNETKGFDTFINQYKGCNVYLSVDGVNKQLKNDGGSYIWFGAVKRGVHTVEISNRCDTARYALGSYHEPMGVHPIALNFNITDPKKGKDFELANFVQPEQSTQVTFEEAPEGNKPTLWSWQGSSTLPFQDTSDLSLTNRRTEDVGIFAELQEQDLTDIELVNPEFQTRVFDEEANGLHKMFKSNFKPKVAGRYEVIVLTKTNLFNARKNVSQEGGATLQDLDIDNSVEKLLSSNEYYYHKGFSHPNFILMVGDDRVPVLVSPNRKLGMSESPASWQHSYFDADDIDVRDGMPFVFWAENTIGNNFDMMKYTPATANNINVKFLWDGGALKSWENISEDDEDFIQKVAIYVKPPNEKHFRALQDYDFDNGKYQINEEDAFTSVEDQLMSAIEVMQIEESQGRLVKGTLHLLFDPIEGMTYDEVWTIYQQVMGRE